MRTTLAGLILLSGGMAAAGPIPLKFVDYTVKEGDTCSGIALRFYKDKERYDIVHDYNPQLGNRPPHRLEVGARLRLPATLPADAWVTEVRSQVEHRPPSTSEWRISAAGTPLRLGWRVSTRADSAAELTFLDTSELHLREETLVILYGKGATGARRKTSRARLERGTLRARLGELAGGARKTPPLEITTVSAETSFSSAEALMSVSPEGTASISNHARGALDVRGTAGGRVKVAQGMGTYVKKGARPAKPRALPTPPRWTGGATAVAVGARAEDALIRARWQVGPGVQGVRVRVRTLAGATSLAEIDLPAATPMFRLRGLPAETYALEASARDKDGLESRWSDPLVVEVRASSGGVPIFVGVDPGLPAGATCTLDGAAAPDGVALAVGGHTVACTLAGAALPPMAFRVAQATARVLGPKRMKRGAKATVRLALDGDGLSPPALDLKVGGASTPLVRHKDGWVATLTVPPGASATAEIRDPDRPEGPPVARVTLPLGGEAR